MITPEAPPDSEPSSDEQVRRNWRRPAAYIMSLLSITAVGGLIAAHLDSKPVVTRPGLLAVGDKITQTSIISPEAGKDSVTTITANHDTPTDLGILYSPGVGQLTGMVGNHNPSNEAGFLFTTADNTVSLQVVIFNAKTEIVNYMTKPIALEDEPQIFDYPNKTDTTETAISVSPVDHNEGITVRFHSYPISPPPVPVM